MINKSFTLQLSVKVGFGKTLSVFVHSPTKAVKVISFGQVADFGASLSVIVTVKLQFAVFPAASFAVIT